MKKITISFLSILLCTPVLGAYQGYFKTAMNIGKRTPYALLCFGPGLLNVYERRHLHLLQHDDNHTLEHMVRSFAHTNSIDTNKLDIKVFNGRLPDGAMISACVLDNRHYFGGNATLLLNSDEWIGIEKDTQDKQNLFYATITHELNHYTEHDALKRSQVLWSSGIIAYLAYSTLLRHPITRISSMLFNSQKIINGTKAIVAAFCALTTHSYMINKCMKISRLQEKRADLSIRNPDHVRAMIRYLIKLETYKRADQFCSGKSIEDPWHPPFSERITYLEEHLETLQKKQKDTQ